MTSLIIFKFFLILLYSFSLLGLIMHKPVNRKPYRYREIFVPLLGTFFYLFYQFVGYIPHQLNFIVVPENTLSLFILIGTLLNTFGFVISIIAVFNLKHAFGILVETHQITTVGLYKIVRHPIYLGYALSTIGICLILPKTGYIFLSLILIALNLYRAVLEESKLLSTYPEYRAYMDNTPFILPSMLNK